ncbi:MAG: DUF475 domain-containing protein [Solirubrobacteraceae bacterium]|nr:DUF475 domain-containing protein [Solirubrobacteraceae bacterium]
MHPLKTFRIPLAITVLSIILSAVFGSVEMAVIVTLLAILEISISFDNAVVNAAVLKTMTPKWQQIFLTWGILIAVFGMRLVFPIVIVAVAAGLSIPEVLDLAFNNQEQYASELRESYPVIASFGGVFLLMVFLNFFFDEEKDHHWLGPIEKPLAKLGHIEGITPAIAAIALLLVTEFIAKPEDLSDVLVAGLVGLVAYLISNGAAGALEESMEDDIEREQEIEAQARREHPENPNKAAAAAAQAAAKGGLASFLYLELLDASFSFDGVIGAFAISTDIIVIAIGLGLGAIYIRTLTVYLVRQGTLSEYRYLEHGAHWAIGVLAVLLFIGIEKHVPEVITGTLGAGFILTAFIFSIRANRRDAAAGKQPEPLEPHQHSL